MECAACKGRGSRLCWSCYGEGLEPVENSLRRCLDCDGKGVHPCRHCQGTGIKPAADAGSAAAIPAKRGTHSSTP